MNSPRRMFFLVIAGSGATKQSSPAPQAGLLRFASLAMTIGHDPPCTLTTLRHRRDEQQRQTLRYAALCRKPGPFEGAGHPLQITATQSISTSNGPGHDGTWTKMRAGASV